MADYKDPENTILIELKDGTVPNLVIEVCGAAHGPRVNEMFHDVEPEQVVV